MKTSRIILIISLIIVTILIGSVSFKDDNKTKKVNTNNENKITINGKKIEVTYENTNKIKEEISFGNTISKIIKIENKNKDQVVFALNVTNLIISNENVTYSVFASIDKETYTDILLDAKLGDTQFLAYDIVVEGKSTIYIKVELKANQEGEATAIKGRINVVNNLTEKEVLLEKLKDDMKALDNKVDALNGISKSGVYTLNIKDINQDLNGYILIDATDITKLKYILFIDNGKYMIRNVNYQYLKKANIKDLDGDTLSDNEACVAYSEKLCTSFSNLTYNTEGKNEFHTNLMNIYNEVKANFAKEEKKVFVLDVKTDIVNNTNIKGYILINNVLDEPEYYLYLTNDLYMVSGYNITKLGEFDKDSITIRAYTATSFNLGAKDKKTVCSFSGFTDCVDINGGSI